MELVFTLTKNATKPNPFEIISLQTTREESNWKTEKNVGESTCNSGDGTDQRVQSLMFMMMMIIRDVLGQRIGLETSVATYQSMPRNIPEEGRSRNLELIYWLSDC